MNFLIEGFSLFSNSELSLLFRYLVWSCEDAVTFRSLAQVNRFCRELAREHRGMKKIEFSRLFDSISLSSWPFKRLRGRILPNGQFHGFAKWTSHFSHLIEPFCVVDASYSFLTINSSYTISKIYTTKNLFIYETKNGVYWHNMKNGCMIRAILCKNCQSFHQFKRCMSDTILSRPCWSKRDLHFSRTPRDPRINGIKRSRVLAILALAKRIKEEK